MRKDRQENKNGGFARFTKIWAVLYFLVTVVFCVALVRLNLLPTKYLGMVLGAIVILILILFPILFGKKLKTAGKSVALILSALLMVGYGLGIVYMSGTMNFFDEITTSGITTEKYFVVVHGDSAAESEADIHGKTIETYMTNELNYSEAKNRLVEEQDVTYEMIESLSDLGNGLLTKQYEIVFISEAHYDAIGNELEDFKEKTKIIYTIEIEKETGNIAKTVDVTSEPFNILVSGLDTEGLITTAARSDVNILVTVNPQTHEILMTSLPRDAYIDLPSKGAKDKLTHTGLYGIEESVAAVEALTGIDVNYYVKVNYSTVVQLVDAIGGITVCSDYTFTTHGMDVYYQFYEGENVLDGSMALAFSRERKSFSDGDFQRNKNQQKVLSAVLQKTLSSQTILTKYTTILDAVEGCVETNMSRKDMQRLIKMQLEDMPSWNLETQSIDGEANTDICYSTGDYYVSVVYLDEASIISAVDKIVAASEIPENSKKDEN